MVAATSAPMCRQKRTSGSSCCAGVAFLAGAAKRVVGIIALSRGVVDHAVMQRPAPVPPPWAADPLADYLARLRTQRQMSDHSVTAYRRDLGQFFCFVATLGGDSVAGVDRSVVREFVADLHAAGYARRSIARKLSAIRSFYRDAARRGLVTANPADGVSRPKLDRPLPKALTRRQMEGALEAVTGDEPKDLRDRAILETLYATGLRVSELAGLHVADVSAGQDSLVVRGKGSKVRVVPIGAQARTWLDRYVNEGRGPLLGDRTSPALWIGSRGADNAPALSRMLFVIHLRHICWKAAPTCVRCNSSWATLNSVPHRFTLP